ncbi:ABC transporter permease [uncultured Aquitalea sp.]|uniref:ABC transporter permease n=1 Tax=uncultured Aquitalea sp. TaxID=540272 RepID=UPI0025ECEDB2|nr:ABC transporter permease [uncultured Aquitalea sp.]
MTARRQCFGLPAIDKTWLLLAGLSVLGLLLPLLTYAPNRLLTGRGLSVLTLHDGLAMALIPAAVLLVAACFAPESPRGLLARAWWSMWFVALLLWSAGHEASKLAGAEDSLARVSFGSGFWLMSLACLLMASESLRRLALPPLRQTLCLAAGIAPALAVLLTGRLDALSLLKEYQNYQDSFDTALIQHMQLVLFSLLPAVAAGTLLGLAAFRWRHWNNWLFGSLNILQTIPSIALFGLLIGPLAWIGKHWPGSGIAGVGAWPAVVALALYSLLPLARATCAGLQQVPQDVRHAAEGIGMTRWQIFRRIDLPLALPMFLGGVRVTAVQSIGLAAVSALIGAGGFGAIMFQGLSGSALDQVLLGVLPVVALAAATDGLFKLAASRLDRNRHD